jgi:hypothetical protein
MLVVKNGSTNTEWAVDRGSVAEKSEFPSSRQLLICVPFRLYITELTRSKLISPYNRPQSPRGGVKV